MAHPTHLRSHLTPVLLDLTHQRAMDKVQEDYPDRFVPLAVHQRELHGETWTLEEYVIAQTSWNQAVADWEFFITNKLQHETTI